MGAQRLGPLLRARKDLLPSVPSLSRAPASARPSTSASLSLVTIASGVPLGTHRPYHDVISNRGNPASITVGISGADASRLPAVTANPFTVPARTCGKELAAKSIMKSIDPAIRSLIPLPR